MANVDEKAKDGLPTKETERPNEDTQELWVKQNPRDVQPSKHATQGLGPSCSDSMDVEDAPGYSLPSPPRLQNDPKTLSTTCNVQHPPNASSEAKDVNVSVSADMEKTEIPSSRNDSASDKQIRGQSPPILAPISTTADPQSSPASTNGPGSSNTPDPTPASPNTSPGEEETVVEHRRFGTESKAEDIATPNVNGTLSNLAGSPSQPFDNTDSFLVNSPELEQEPALKPDLQPLSPPKESTPSTDSGQIRRAGSVGSKPTMRIDTRTGNSTDTKLRGSGSIMESPLPMTSSATPRRAPGSASAGHSPHRRETRIASGALERRSVSDILGETPKSSPYVMKSTADSPISAGTRESFDLATSKGRLADREKLEKERSKLSTVVFAKPQTGETDESAKALRRVSGEVLPRRGEQRDYLLTLFESKAYSPPRSAPLASLLQSAHKTLATADHLIEYQEQMNCRTLKRIYQLQSADRWALRQHQRAVEPARPTSHWDFLLDHAKWMRTDFREERKWKLAAARGVAEWCAEWVASNAKERRLLQVKVKPPKRLAPAREAEDVVMADQPGPVESSDSTPDLVASAEDDSVSDGFIEDPVDIHTSNAPAAIFSLGSSDFSYPINKTPAADKMFNELPLYEPAKIEPDAAKSDLAERLDARWKTDIVAVSRFATCKLRVQDWKVPSKRSRYEYAEDSPPPKDTVPLPPEQTDVALFMPENKHIRDRIHPGHSFRPPSEHPMPSQAFFESRSSSQWLPAEDDELRRLVKEYSYNWSLISSCLSPRSLFVSGADRRTPWECFERWIGLEGLPADMLKTPYFKAYHSRIEAANRHVIAQQEAAQRQSDNPQMPLRKRTTTPVHIERKRNQKHLAMLDAMRKLAKKRETAIQKQQHANDLAAMRKVNEASQPRPPITTPAEFSRLKHDREQKMAERQEIYRQQILAHQKATMRTAQQLAQGNAPPNGVPRGAGNGPPGSSSGPPVALPNATPTANGAANGQRAHMNMQGLPAGVIPNGQMPPSMMPYKGMTPAQVQANVVASRGMSGHSPEQMMRIQAEAHRLQQQQMLAVQARQAQHSNSQNGPHSSPSMVNAAMANGNGGQNAAAALAQYAATNGMSSPSAPNNGSGSSPRMANGSAMGQALSSGHTPTISQLIAEVQARNPEMPPDEVNRQATARLNHYQKQQALHGHAVQQAQRNAMQQAALNAAAGAVNPGPHNAGNLYHPQRVMTNEQVQAFHTARQQQQRQGAIPGPMGMTGLAPGAGGHGMVGGITGSPVLPMARPVSSHTPHSRSATPREQRSGSIGMNGAQGSPRVSQQSMQT